MVLALHRFSAIGQKRHSRKILSWFFKFDCWPRPFIFKKEGFYQQMQNSILNRLEPIRNRKNCLPFLFCTLSLSVQFNWNTVFPEFWTLLVIWKLHFKSGRSKKKKNSRFRQKSLQNDIQRKILRRKIRKTCFHYIFFSCFFACIYLFQ